MKDFAALFTAVDQTTKTNAKVAAMRDFFEVAEPRDKLWMIALFSGRRPKRTVTTALLKTWAAEVAEIPLWLFEESYPIVGDLAETIALVLPEAEAPDDIPLHEWIAFQAKLKTMEEPDRKAAILASWNRLDTTERFLFNKLLTGGFRIGISQKLMTRALSQATGQEEAEVTHKLMGDWTPETVTYESLVLSDDPTADQSKPYPFYLAYGLDGPPKNLGPPTDWRAEWKWDGIRGQLILRDGTHHLWSRGEDLMTPRFPELARAVDFLPEGTVLDGEVLAWDFETNTPMSFASLQKRIGRKTVPKKLLADAPVILRAYDLLEDQGEDIRALPYKDRRARLEGYFKDLPTEAPLVLSEWIDFNDWDALAKIREGSRDNN
ncbi:MAG: ATP-dependent DNA ligase, partial [Planktomarina sp.]